MRRLALLARRRALTVAGLMSGTSADGTDVCIARISERIPPAGPRVRIISHAVVPHPAALREVLLSLAQPGADIDLLARADFALGEAFAAALLAELDRIGLRRDRLDLVGSHGQTVRHLPRAPDLAGLPARSTLQIGETAVIAERTGAVVVGDFRVRDVAAGGEGAPLVAHVDRLLFAQPDRTVACQNIGGIGNVTVLPAPSAGVPPIAFDTGPGNMVIDAVTRHATRGRHRYDEGGQMAASGRIDEALLSWLMSHPFLARPPPRSAGREEFGAPLVEELIARRSDGTRVEDLVATATAFTARSIEESYRRFVRPFPDEVLVSGGGAHNATLMEMLAARLAPAAVVSSADHGIPVQAKEALAFAMLAYEAVRGRSAGCPWATGARSSVVLGKIVP